MEENNNPFNQTNQDNQENKTTGGDAPAADNGQTESEHTGYEQPGYQDPQNPVQGQQTQQNVQGYDPQRGYNSQGYSQNNSGQYGQSGYQQSGQYEQNSSQNQQYNQNPYGYNQYNQNPYYQGQYQQNQPPKSNNSMAVASLVCGIVSLLISCCWFISLPLSIVSIVLGIIVLKNKKDGRTLAIIGIIISAATIIICIILIAFYAYMFTGNGEFSNYYKQFYNEFYNDVESSVY